MRLTPAEQKRLADAFLLGVDSTRTPEVEGMIQAAVRSIHTEFARLPVEVRWTKRDPYASYAEMRDQVLSTNVLYIWTGASDVPMWDEKTNWMARAVHDWDHISNQFDFTMDGEFEGFRVAARKNPQLAPLYLSEIAMQAAVANTYGGFATEQKIVLVEDPKLKTWIKQLGGLGGTSGNPHGRRRLDDVAMLLTTTTPTQTMLQLAYAGYSYGDALLLIQAAMNYNALIQGAMRY